MKRYEREIRDLLNKNQINTIIMIIISIILTVFLYYHTKERHYIKYEIISEPTLGLRTLSALSFIGLGKLLYHLKFYYLLYIFLVKILKQRRIYKKLKKTIWNILCGITGFIILPRFIDKLNTILSLIIYKPYIILSIGIFLIIINLALSKNKD